MNTINKALVGDYFQKKAEVQALRQSVQIKRAEAGELEHQIGVIKTDINELQTQLNTAERDMHGGSLSHDEFLQFKRDMAKKTEEFKGLSEALAEKKEAIAVLQSNLTRVGRPIGNIKRDLASDMVEQFASEVVELAGEPFKNLIHALVVSKGVDNGYTLNEKNRYRQNLYVMICEAIFKTVSDNHGEPVITIPDLDQANQQVDGFISKMAEA